MNIQEMEKFIESLDCEVYPITLIKYLLNKRRILSYFQKAASPNFEIRGMTYTLNNSNCVVCQEKHSEGILCRQHTSLERVLQAKNLAYDLDTKVYFYKNEIFRMVNHRLVIVYCPHPKLITGEITDAKARKVTPITIEDPNLTKLPEYERVTEFLSTQIMSEHMKCWFNKEFSLVTIPEDRGSSNWCLIPNN